MGQLNTGYASPPMNSYATNNYYGGGGGGPRAYAAGDMYAGGIPSSGSFVAEPYSRSGGGGASRGQTARDTYGGGTVPYGPSPGGYTAGDTYAGGAVSYGPSPGQMPDLGYGGGFGLPTSGSFVAEPFALGAPPPMQLMAERPVMGPYAADSSSFVAPYGAGGFSDFNYGNMPPSTYPSSAALLSYGGYGGGPGPPGPSSFGAGGPPPGGLGGLDASFGADARQPSNNYYASYGASPAASGLKREEMRREDNAFEAGAAAQGRQADKAELSKKAPGDKPTSSSSGRKQSDSRDPQKSDSQRRTKKRHGYQCLGC